MESPLRILHLEDDVMDTELLRAMLEMEKIVAEVERVETREQFLRALKAGGYDIIISDYSLPAFDGLSALAMAREHGPTIPFILFSGTIGEEAAVAARVRRPAPSPAGRGGLARTGGVFPPDFGKRHGFDRGHRSRRQMGLQQPFLQEYFGRSGKAAEQGFIQRDPSRRPRAHA